MVRIFGIKWVIRGGHKAHKIPATSAYLDPAGNVGANMAWAESYVLDSYLNMYRLTGNVDYLNTFISQYKKIKDAYYINGAWLPLLISIS